MSILAWIEDQRTAQLLDAPKYTHKDSTPITRSQGLWTRCDNCGVILYIKHLKENIRVCFGCGYHLQMESSERISSLIDPGTWRPLDEILSPVDPLQFKDQKPYVERLRDAQKKTGLQDAIQTGTGLLHGIPIALGVMDFHFMGGSMGSVVGEKITRLIEYATEEGYTLILVCASGGARMQEGIYSLMQMAKISSALQVYQSCANLLYISVITSPTTGGVTASFAMLGDLVFAEPKALIGFAGRRVIEQTLQEELPEDFQTAEYLLHHGLLDLIVPRCFLKAALSEIIYLYKNAPNKRSGFIPYGVVKNLSFLEIESILRSLKETTIYSQPEIKAYNKIIGDGGTDKGVTSVKKFNNDTVQTPANSIFTSLISKNLVLSNKTKETLNIASPIQKNTVVEAGQTNYSHINRPGEVTELMFSTQDPEYKDNSETNLKTFYSKSRASFKALFNYLEKGVSDTSESTSQKDQNVSFYKNRTTDWLSAIDLATTQKIHWMWGPEALSVPRPKVTKEGARDTKNRQPKTDFSPPLVLSKG